MSPHVTARYSPNRRPGMITAAPPSARATRFPGGVLLQRALEPDPDPFPQHRHRLHIPRPLRGDRHRPVRDLRRIRGAGEQPVPDHREGAALVITVTHTAMKKARTSR